MKAASSALGGTALLLLLSACDTAPRASPPPGPVSDSPSFATEFGGKIEDSIRDSTPDFADDPVAAPTAPNIVFIVADDLGFADLGSYGSEIATPNLDRLAARGLRYSNFTVTAMCSPTRAALLTGLNHHSAGVGWVSEWDFGYPGYRGELAPDVVTLPRILQQHGYATLAAGKWHLTRGEHRSASGPHDSWPTHQGFDRYWGFLEGETDQFAPAFIVSGTEIEPRAPAAGGYFPDELTQRAIQMVQDLRAADPRKPFFLYYAPGAVHAPHQTLEADRQRQVGRYAMGWDAIRAQRLARQKQLGIVPENTDLAPRNPGVQAWDSLTGDQRRMYARFQENYAAFVGNLDSQVGRLLGALQSRGELDNTIVIFLSDNGASPEGDIEGQANGLAYFHFHRTTNAENLGHFEDLGSAATHPHYPLGWTQASNTPFRHTKRTTHGGGVHVPFIISWPRGIAAQGGIRTQYHHVNDVVPTLLELLHIAPPARMNGAVIRPIEGTSFAYSLADAGAPGRKREQYYELEGNRGYYADGWKLVALRDADRPFGEAPWELYDLTQDFSEAHDLAARHPDRVKRLEEKWWQAARRHQVLPLIDVALLERPRYSKFMSTDPPKARVLPAGAATLPQFVAPVLPGRSYTISAEIERQTPAQSGVLVAQGDRHSGYTLFVRNNRLIYERNIGSDVVRIVSPTELPVGKVAVQFRFDKVSTGLAVTRGLLSDGPDFNRLAVLAGTGSLWVNGRRLAEAKIPQPFMVAWEGLDVGRDTGSPVSPDYAADAPFAFGGLLEQVTYQLQ